MIDIPEDGIDQFKLENGNTIDFDVFLLGSELEALSEETRDSTPTDFFRGVQRVLQQYGFPTMSSRRAVEFSKAVLKKVGELQKKSGDVEPGADAGESPVSTASDQPN